MLPPMEKMDMLDRFLDGTLEVDGEIALKSARAEYRGIGEIRQHPDGVLRFKLYCKHNVGEVVDTLGRISRATPGKLIEEEDLFGLEARDFRGDRWTAEAVVPRAEHYLNARKTLLRGELRSLVHKIRRPLPPGSTLVLHFVGQDLRRWNGLIGSAILSSPMRDTQVQVQARDADGVAVTINCPDALPAADLPLRVCEALWFVLGITVSPSVIQWHDSEGQRTEYFSPTRRSVVQALPPLRVPHDRQDPHMFRMFEDYLRYACLKGGPDEPGVCSIHLRHAIEASANSDDAWALAICVAFEGIAGLVPVGVDLPTPEVIDRVKKIIAMLDREPLIPREIAERAKGSVSRLSEPRLKDRLLPLIENGSLDVRAWNAWNALRHARAHGTLTKAGRAETERLIDNIFLVTSGLHQVIFHLIGYQGGFTNYGRADPNTFARTSYPLEVEAPVT